MITWFQRQNLIRKGLSCDRTRRHHEEKDWRDWLETSPVLRVLIIALFAILLGAFCHLSSLVFYRTLILASIIYVYGLLLLRFDLPQLFHSNSRLLLVFLCMTINISITRWLSFWSMNQQSVAYPQTFFLIPIAFAPLILTVLMGTRAGLCVVILDGLFDTLFIRERFALLLVHLLVGLAGVVCARRVRRRSSLIRAGFVLGAVGFICTAALGEAEVGYMNPLILQQASIAAVAGLLTAMVVNSFLPIVENIFGIITDISWIEMADLNHPLLRRMSVEAPGTFHHSLVLANLAETAADAIGANSTQCRVLAYFHDIGKLNNPEYFTENQGGGPNPHKELSPNMSALIVLSHVKDGVDLAMKHHLKEPIIDVIQQHHGDTLVYYFYKLAQKQAEDAKVGGEILGLRPEDIPEVSENSFRYPGPRPQTKEIALIMLSDAVEGASRSLEKPNAQRLEGLVEDIIQQKIRDHQLDDSGLSLKEIRMVKQRFVFTLKTMLHGRVSYPKDETELQDSDIQSPKKYPAASPQDSAPDNGSHSPVA